MIEAATRWIPAPLESARVPPWRRLLRRASSGLLATAACLVLAPPVLASGATAVLPDFSDVRGLSERQARDAIAAVARERRLREPDWAARDKRCYDEVLVNSCRQSIRNERRSVERELNRIEVGARQMLREHQAQRRRDAQDERRRSAGNQSEARPPAAKAPVDREARAAALAERQARNARRHAQAAANEAKHREKQAAAQSRRKSGTQGTGSAHP